VRTYSKRSSLALDAVHAAIDALARAPDSEEKARLLEEARACETVVEGWRDATPSPNDREVTMRRILALNVAVAKLQRGRG
jgi:hypothetical protein